MNEQGRPKPITLDFSKPLSAEEQAEYARYLELLKNTYILDFKTNTHKKSKILKTKTKKKGGKREDAEYIITDENGEELNIRLAHSIHFAKDGQGNEYVVGTKSKFNPKNNNLGSATNPYHGHRYYFKKESTSATYTQKDSETEQFPKMIKRTMGRTESENKRKPIDIDKAKHGVEIANTIYRQQGAHEDFEFLPLISDDLPKTTEKFYIIANEFKSDLFDVITENNCNPNLSIQDKLDISMAILKATASMHGDDEEDDSKKHVHRDIKIENICVEKDSTGQWHAWYIDTELSYTLDKKENVTNYGLTFSHISNNDLNSIIEIGKQENKIKNYAEIQNQKADIFAVAIVLMETFCPKIIEDNFQSIKNTNGTLNIEKTLAKFLVELDKIDGLTPEAKKYIYALLETMLDEQNKEQRPTATEAYKYLKNIQNIYIKSHGVFKSETSRENSERKSKIRSLEIPLKKADIKKIQKTKLLLSFMDMEKTEDQILKEWLENNFEENNYDKVLNTLKASGIFPNFKMPKKKEKEITEEAGSSNDDNEKNKNIEKLESIINTIINTKWKIHGRAGKVMTLNVLKNGERYEVNGLSKNPRTQIKKHIPDHAAMIIQEYLKYKNKKQNPELVLEKINVLLKNAIEPQEKSLKTYWAIFWRAESTAKVYGKLKTILASELEKTPAVKSSHPISTRETLSPADFTLKISDDKSPNFSKIVLCVHLVTHDTNGIYEQKFKNLKTALTQESLKFSKDNSNSESIAAFVDRLRKMLFNEASKYYSTLLKDLQKSLAELPEKQYQELQEKTKEIISIQDSPAPIKNNSKISQRK